CTHFERELDFGPVERDVFPASTLIMRGYGLDDHLFRPAYAWRQILRPHFNGSAPALQPPYPHRDYCLLAAEQCLVAAHDPGGKIGLSPLHYQPVRKRSIAAIGVIAHEYRIASRLEVYHEVRVDVGWPLRGVDGRIVLIGDALAGRIVEHDDG